MEIYKLRAPLFAGTAPADELPVEDILAVGHDVIPLHGDYVFQQGVSDSKLNATESPKLFATERKSRDIIVLLLE